MYHEIVPEIAPRYLERTGLKTATAPIYANTVAAFEAHLGLLREHSIPIRRWDEVDASSTGEVTCLLTFDDGGRSNFELAKPVLDRFDVKAHFFVVTNLLDSSNFMSSGQVRQLHAEGHVIGSHGATHRYFPQLSDEEVLAELRSSRARIEELTGAPCRLLSIPGGFLPARVRPLISRAGYQVVFTSVPAHESARSIGRRPLGRVAPRAGDSLARFAAAVLPPHRGIRRQYLRHLVLEVAKKVLGPGLFLALRSRLASRRGAPRSSAGLSA